MKFIVEYSKEKDIWNHLKTNWKFSFKKHGREDIKDRIKKSYPEKYLNDLWSAKTEEEARKIVTLFLDYLPKQIQNTTPLIVRGVNQLLNERSEDIISKLEKAYEEKFPFDEITVYIHTCLFSPYNYEEKWFMSPRNSSEDEHIKTALHELNHFMFYSYYPNLRKELGNDKYETVKEALAIFTNPEGNDKPEVKKLEDFFKNNLNKSIGEVLKDKNWLRYI
jgi:hypothetical protein